MVIKAVKELVFKRKIKVISLNDSRQYNFNNVTDTLNFEIGGAVDFYRNNKNRENTTRGLKCVREANRVGGRLRKPTREEQKTNDQYILKQQSINIKYM